MSSTSPLLSISAIFLSLHGFSLVILQYREIKSHSSNRSRRKSQGCIHTSEFTRSQALVLGFFEHGQAPGIVLVPTSLCLLKHSLAEICGELRQYPISQKQNREDLAVLWWENFGTFHHEPCATVCICFNILVQA